MLQDNNTVPDSSTSQSPAQRTTVDFAAMVQAMDEATSRWHREPPPHTELPRVLQLHRANFDLWHLEDEARSTGATAEEIVRIKRAIDRVNQQRNDHAEAIDVELLDLLAAHNLPAQNAPLHSETPGQMLDRLSILSLKRFHTEEEIHRSTAQPAHRQRNLARLAILQEQTHDLLACLQHLWTAIEQGQRKFKRYRQLKMYNDPELNPVIYRSASAE